MPAEPTTRRRALAIRQPWAWLIVNGYKDVENRQWRTNFRGPVLIHASKCRTKAEWKAAVAYVRSIRPDIEIPPEVTLPTGGIVGEAEIVACTNSQLATNSKWYMPVWTDKGWSFAFILANAKQLPFTPIKGRLGFFMIDYEQDPKAKTSEEAHHVQSV